MNENTFKSIIMVLGLAWYGVYKFILSVVPTDKIGLAKIIFLIVSIIITIIIYIIRNKLFRSPKK